MGKRKNKKIIGLIAIGLVLCFFGYVAAEYELHPWKNISGLLGKDGLTWREVWTNAVVFEGASDDAYETTLAVTDPTADRTITFPNATGAPILSSGGAPDAANAISGGTGTLVFEGATANTVETSLAVEDPTASDKTVTLPNQTGTVLVSPGGVSSYTNAIWGGNSSILFEGATQDAYETTLTVTDATADRTVTLPDQTGTAILSAGGVSGYTNAISGGTGTLIWEGATQDAYETTLAVTDPTADVTATLPNSTGTISYEPTVTAKTASYTLTGDDVNGHKTFTNEGTAATTEVIFKFNSTTAGDLACFANSDADAVTLTVDPNDAVQILGETNAAGDKVQSATRGETICIEIVTSTTAVSLGGFGTWDDAD
jgi:hypothetical protein